MILKQLIWIFLLSFIISCQKKNNATPNNSNNTTTGSYNNTIIGGELYTLNKQFSNGSINGLEDSLVYAYFYDLGAGGNYANAGTVSYNGVVLGNYLNQYQDTTFTIINTHQSNSEWNVGGSSLISGFTHSFTPSFPAFNGNALLPDSFSLSTGITINFGNTIVNNNDTILLTITTDDVIKKIAPNQTSCTLTPSDLMFVSANNNGNIRLQFSNKRSIVYGNKEYYLYNNLWHTKYGVKIKQ